MTNEEAIEQFQNAIDLINQNGKDWLDARDIPMLEMAIKALEFQQKVYKRKDEIYFKEGVTPEENAEYYALAKLLGVIE